MGEEGIYREGARIRLTVRESLDRNEIKTGTDIQTWSASVEILIFWGCLPGKWAITEQYVMTGMEFTNAERRYCFNLRWNVFTSFYRQRKYDIAPSNAIWIIIWGGIPKSKRIIKRALLGNPSNFLHHSMYQKYICSMYIIYFFYFWPRHKTVD